MMPELRRDDRGQSHLDRKSRERAGSHLAEAFAPVRHLFDIEITSFAQRIFTQELADKFRLGIHVKTVERRTKDDLAAPGDRLWNPTFREHSEQVFVA